ncbi:MAG: hypothetical protein CM15mP22_5750 [Gammaproteobacteria bacterium]|nr:MAG: hypothetical protein CM15mP22_5750 [Gammaproteobacteria bacterium]
MPAADVALLCASISIRRTFLLALESAAARLTAVVVLPTPPLLVGNCYLIVINFYNTHITKIRFILCIL